MDVQIPNMDGVEATRIIRSAKDETIDQDIPIKALTAHVFEEDKKKFRNAGMNTCITKPFRGRDLFREIERLVPIRVEKNDAEPVRQQDTDKVIHKEYVMDQKNTGDSVVS